MLSPSLRHLGVKDAYDLWADGYDAQDNPMVLGATQILARRVPDLAGSTVIEFGCGTGRNLEALAKSGAASVTGVDLSPGMLAHARTRVPAATLIESDFAGAALPEGAFDMALFCLALEHAGDLRGPLTAARRTLRGDGRVLIVEIHPDLAAAGTGAHFERDGGVVTMPTHAHRRSDYLDGASTAGLRLVRAVDWRPRDFDRTTPRMLKRGPDAMLLIELEFAPD